MNPAEVELLKRITGGWLIIDLHTLRVKTYNPWHGRWRTKSPRQHEVSGRWKFSFNMRLPGEVKRQSFTIYRNRLVWIYVNRELPPSGYVVDHKDTDNQNDDPSNLQLMPRAASHIQGYMKQTEPSFYECCLYFEAIAFLGREPAWS